MAGDGRVFGVALPEKLGAVTRYAGEVLLRLSVRGQGCSLRGALIGCAALGWGFAGVAMAQERLPDSPGFVVAEVAAAGQMRAAMGGVTGTVTDRSGTLLVGARVVLSDEASGRTQETNSDEEGAFRFAGVGPGAFRVEVTLDGFVPGTANGRTETGQSVAVGPIALTLAAVNVRVDVVATQEEIAGAQLQMEEKQRLVGLFPNFFVSYDWRALPLTTRQKFSLAWKNAYDPGNLVLVGFTAGVQQAADAFPGYGQGAAGYGKRYGADLGNLVIGTMLGGAVLPSLFHQDPRYFYKGTGTVKSRALYAMSTAVVCRGDNGKRQIAWASMLGDLSAGAISNAYYAPSDRQGARLTIENGFLGIAGDAFNGLMQELVLPRLTTRAKGLQRTP